MPPDIISALPQAFGGLVFVLGAAAYVLSQWRRGLAERTIVAEKELKELRETSSTEIAKLEQQIKAMKVDFDRQLDEIQEKLNEQIERLESENITQRSIVYRLRTRMAENGLAHDDIT